MGTVNIDPPEPNSPIENPTTSAPGSASNHSIRVRPKVASNTLVRCTLDQGIVRLANSLGLKDKAAVALQASCRAHP